MNCKLAPMSSTYEFPTSWSLEQDMYSFKCKIGYTLNSLSY